MMAGLAISALFWACMGWAVAVIFWHYPDRETIDRQISTILYVFIGGSLAVFVARYFALLATAA